MKHRSRKRTIALASAVAALAMAAGFTWPTLSATTVVQPGTAKVPGNAWPPKRAGSTIAEPLTPEQALETFSLLPVTTSSSSPPSRWSIRPS